MRNLNKYKKIKNPFQALKLPKNPFNISPLFGNFRDKALSKIDEEHIVLPKYLDDEIVPLLISNGLKILPYGEYGVGKTSFINFLLYLSFNNHGKFAVRIIITEENIKSATNELLFTICHDIIRYMKPKFADKLGALRKLKVKLRYGAFLIEEIQKLQGAYEEQKTKNPDHHISLSNF